MTDNDNEISVVRRWINNQRIDIGSQIAALQGKLSMLNQMERELGKVVPAMTPAPRIHKPSTHSKVQSNALLALEAAGKKGLTSKELAEVAQVPIGSASGRLTLMFKEGLVSRDNGRYFVVHSTQEDNNSAS